MWRGAAERSRRVPRRGETFRPAYGFLRNRPDAEDATAAAFLELWRKRTKVRLVNGSVQPDFKSPEEALAWQSAHAGTSVEIPVYRSDGETKVGVFRVGG